MSNSAHEVGSDIVTKPKEAPGQNGREEDDPDSDEVDSEEEVEEDCQRKEVVRSLGRTRILTKLRADSLFVRQGMSLEKQFHDQGCYLVWYRTFEGPDWTKVMLKLKERRSERTRVARAS